jgi:hypothetical protein
MEVIEENANKKRKMTDMLHLKLTYLVSNIPKEAVIDEDCIKTDELILKYEKTKKKIESIKKKLTSIKEILINNNKVFNDIKEKKLEYENIAGNEEEINMVNNVINGLIYKHENAINDIDKLI